jgi:amidase
VARRGVMAVSGDFGVLRDRFEGMSFQMVPIEAGLALVAGANVPVRPMIGVIGVAPAGAPVPCGSPGSHGGNMDTRLIGEGATLYLPVFAPGALLAAGDLHAAMGDGEICGTGVEVAGSVRLRVDLRRDLELANPVVETSEVVATIASAVTLDEAAELATSDMADLLMRRLGLSAQDATTLMSAAGQLQVSQVVDPLKTARYAMSKETLAPFGRDLI